MNENGEYSFLFGLPNGTYKAVVDVKKDSSSIEINNFSVVGNVLTDKGCKILVCSL